MFHWYSCPISSTPGSGSVLSRHPVPVLGTTLSSGPPASVLGMTPSSGPPAAVVGTMPSSANPPGPVPGTSGPLTNSPFL